MFSVMSLQTAKNFRRLYVILLALCVCCLLCGVVCAKNITWPRQGDIFALGETQVPVTVDGVEQNITTDLRYLSYFISSDGVMVALARGEYTKDGKRNSIIVAKYIETEGENWTDRVIENNGVNWRTQLAMHNNIERESFNFLLNNFMAAANKNKIYLFAFNFIWPLHSPKLFFQDFELYYSVGEIKTKATAQRKEKIIEWQSLDQQADSLTRQLKRELPNAIVYATTVSFIKDNKITFVFEANMDGKYVSLFVSSNEMENMIEWDVLHVYPPEGCYKSRFVMWESELLMFPNGCVDGKQTVMKSLDMGNTWTTAEPSFVRLLNYIGDKDELTVATINNKTAFMFTQIIFNETVSGKKCEIHFWVSDGNRMRNIGPVAADDDDIFPTGIVYTNGELFFMHQKLYNYQSKKITLSHLDDELTTITSVLDTWDNMDKYLSKPCRETAGQNAPLDTFCVTPVPIDGLIGFLSDGVGNNNTYWRDEYLCVSAIVKGGTKVTNGFTFIGADAGAKWRLNNKRQRPYYAFVEYGLTAVATVRIHSALGSNTPLLTVGGAEQLVKRQGLWYGSDRQWRVKSGGNNTDVAAARGWETNKTYRVALVVHNNNVVAYVDGRYVGSDVLWTPVTERRPFGYLNLFIAGYGNYQMQKSFSNVTVTNVLLYERQLNETEIMAMSNTLES